MEAHRNFYKEHSLEEMNISINQFYDEMKNRRTVRTLSSREVPREIIIKCVQIAGTAPSGANIQPWHFVVVSNPDLKKEIRKGAEENEKEFYSHKASEEWLNALTKFNTNVSKPFLETAPYLIIPFAQKTRTLDNGKKEANYYVNESVGIATGFLITAIHKAGLVCLPYSPSPMNFLNKLLNRPENEKAVLVIAVGYPSEDATVPMITKKELDEFATFI